MRTKLSALAVSTLTVLLLAGPVAASPLDTGCPTSHEAKTVDQWASMGYPGPGGIDQAGNQDGIVCGLPLPEGFTWSLTVRGFAPHNSVLYLFSDNTNPARR